MDQLIDKPQLVNPFRTRLRDVYGNSVAFDASPELTETRQTNYHSLDPTHMPGSIQVFKNSNSRTFNLSSAKFLSRTPAEADNTIKRLWVLRSWGMPRFGTGSSTTDEWDRFARFYRDLSPDAFYETQANPDNDWDLSAGGEINGAPPQIVFLSAYSSDAISGVPQHIRKVPTVLGNLSIPYPTDVDYIGSSNGIPVPTIMSVDLTLTETHSPVRYENFSLYAYKSGTLPGF